MGVLPHMLSTLRSKETRKQHPFAEKELKKFIRTELCTTKYMNYMHTYKTGLDQLVK